MATAEAIHQLGLENVVLIGHSMGCQVVVETLTRHPGIASSGALIGPVVNAAERRPLKLVLRFVQSVARETASSVLPSVISWCRSGLLPTLHTFWPMLGYRIEDRIRAVEIPLTLVGGALDTMVPTSWLELLAKCVGGSTVNVTVVEDAAHQVMVTHPDRVAEQVLQISRTPDAA